MSSPGPHAILLVLQIGRFTEEEQRSVELIQNIFQSDAAQYTILIFTHADKLKRESFQDFISKQDKKIQDLLERFDRRVLPFNNGDSEDHGQVANLLEMIDHMLAHREKPYFTSQAFQNMDKALAVFQQEHLEENWERIEREKKCAIEKLEADWTDFYTQMTDKRQEAELKKRHIKQNIKMLSVRMAEVEQELKVETRKLKKLKNTRKQRENKYRKKTHSEIRRVEEEIVDRYSMNARQGSSDFLRRNALIILGGGALLASGVGIGAGVAVMTASAPAAAAAATCTGGLAVLYSVINAGAVCSESLIYPKVA
ncbi:hypothetical protein SKAU_G00294870 [Synaphobranchus kaupii]|uniref:AIG1-type G domain-containing protein n=1 Tax=Synaphobranchus kaupii TaxID=118154 RepID=A0A9Q1EUG4_SYNKA|nr:hypothetical protein SKAU_G00294870 [Synaphobranchus kaupii]